MILRLQIRVELYKKTYNTAAEFLLKPGRLCLVINYAKP